MGVMRVKRDLLDAYREGLHWVAKTRRCWARWRTRSGMATTVQSWRTLWQTSETRRGRKDTLDYVIMDARMPALNDSTQPQLRYMNLVSVPSRVV